MSKKSIKSKVKYRVVGSYIQYDRTGHLKQSGDICNLVTTSGDQWIADLLADTPTKVLFTNAYMILGTGWISAAKGDIWVTTGYAGNGKVMDVGYPTVALAVLTLKTTFAAGEGTSNGIDEAVIASANSGAAGANPGAAYILAHSQITPEVNKSAGDTLVLSWSVTYLGA